MKKIDLTRSSSPDFIAVLAGDCLEAENFEFIIKFSAEISFVKRENVKRIPGKLTFAVFLGHVL